MKERCGNYAIRRFFTTFRMTAAVEVNLHGTATQYIKEQPLGNRPGALSDARTDTPNSGGMVRKAEVDDYSPTDLSESMGKLDSPAHQQAGDPMGIKADLHARRG
jgi:hypothetical protein